MDGRPNSRNKEAFSNLSDVVSTSLFEELLKGQGVVVIAALARSRPSSSPR